MEEVLAHRLHHTHDRVRSSGGLCLGPRIPRSEPIERDVPEGVRHPRVTEIGDPRDSERARKPTGDHMPSKRWSRRVYRVEPTAPEDAPPGQQRVRIPPEVVIGNAQADGDVPLEVPQTG